MSSPETTATAVIGCGYWGRTLVRTLKSLGALACVNDGDVGAAQAFAAHAGVPARPLPELLDDPAIAAIVVAVPEARQYRLARRALEAGKNVLVARPLGLSAEEGERLCNLAQVRGRTLTMSQPLLYHPAFLRLKAMVATGALGRLYAVSVRRLNLEPGKLHAAITPDAVTMVLALMGGEPETVWSCGEDGLTTAHLSFRAGRMAQIGDSWLQEETLVVVGENGTALFDETRPWCSKLMIERNGAPHAIPVVQADPVALELRQFLESISGRNQARQPRQVLSALRVLAAARDSLDSGAPEPVRKIATVARSLAVPCPEREQLPRVIDISWRHRPITEDQLVLVGHA